MKMPNLCCLAFAVILASDILSSAQDTIVRSPFIGGGDVGAVGPFDMGDLLDPSMRYQQVYGASDFIERMPQGGFIDAIRFDVALREHGGHAFETTLSALQINLSTTARSVDGLSATFAENVGANNTIVFDLSSITLSDFAAGGADVIIPLTRPFFYDPRAGNLLMDVFNFGQERTSPFNANNSTLDTVSSVYSIGTANDPSGRVLTLGLITVFDVRPVPEPSTWALLAAGSVFLGLRRLRNRSKSTARA